MATKSLRPFMIHRLIRLSLAIVIHPQYTEGNNTEVVKPGIISGNFISLEGLLLLYNTDTL